MYNGLGSGLSDLAAARRRLQESFAENLPEKRARRNGDRGNRRVLRKI